MVVPPGWNRSPVARDRPRQPRDHGTLRSPQFRTITRSGAENWRDGPESARLYGLLSFYCNLAASARLRVVHCPCQALRARGSWRVPDNNSVYGLKLAFLGKFGQYKISTCSRAVF